MQKIETGFRGRDLRTLELQRFRTSELQRSRTSEIQNLRIGVVKSKLSGLIRKIRFIRVLLKISSLR